MSNEPQTIKSVMNSPEVKPEKKKFRPFIPTGKHNMSLAEAQEMCPKIELINEDSGEVILVNQYKIWCKWRPECKVNGREDYVYLDAMIIRNHFNLYGKLKYNNIFQMFRDFIPEKERTTETLIVYDNTGLTSHGVIYKSVYDRDKQKQIVQVNFVMPGLYGYEPYPYKTNLKEK